ncbi:MAG: hypothetical protein K8H88_23970, partial [Sandaracinaceae bacterium]|nr:hypothetical protein [Sandaracinaceae bacterium]
YGRDMGCEQRISAACSTVAPGNYCTIGAGFYIAAGGNVTIGCATPALARTDIMNWELMARHSGCDGSASEYNACQAAAHRYCIEHGHATGYTFRTGALTYSLICFSSSQAEMRSVSWADLDAHDGAAEAYCAGPSRDGWWCARAADSVCRSLGYATGFGPVEYAAGGTSVACVRSY